MLFISCPKEFPPLKLPNDSLMFVPCVIWLSITDQHYAPSYITPLFDKQAATCFGTYVLSSGSFSFLRELLESRNVYVVCHILWVLLACVHWLLWFRVLRCPAERICFYTSALEGGESSSSRPGRFLPPGKTRYLLYRRLGGPHDRYGKVRKIS
jgi:hypothetical protein